MDWSVKDIYEAMLDSNCTTKATQAPTDHGAVATYNITTIPSGITSRIVLYSTVIVFEW